MTVPAHARDRDDVEICALVLRLARPIPAGGDAVARAAILAEGGDVAAVVAWITAHGGVPEATTVVARSGTGLHGARGSTAIAPASRRFVFPPDALASVRPAGDA